MSCRQASPSQLAAACVEAAATLTIDLDALAANWRLLAAKVAPVECSAVVKADAYGIGIEPAVGALLKAGCRTFFVAQLAEGQRVRAVAADAIIYVLNGLAEEAEDVYWKSRLRPVLGSDREIARWRRFARASNAPCSAAIHVDTGMNRLGLAPDEAAPILGSSDLLGFDVSLLMSHFVSSEQPENALNGRQIDAFERLRRLRPDVPASLANSSGIFLPQRPFLNLVRAGYALYGGNPTPQAPNPMRPVVRLEAPIIQCRTIEAGETVGYNAQWTARRRTRLATIGVGYADGFPRAASATDSNPGGSAVVGGAVCPFAGRVSMDLIVIDITDAPPGIAPGERVELIGDRLTVDDVGASAGTIGYEVLTSLGRRYRRVFIGG